MLGTLMFGLVFACLLHGGDHQELDIRKFAGVWYHTAEIVNGSLRNELDSVKIKAKIEYNGGIMLEIRRVRNGECESDVMYLAPTDYAEEFETIRLSKVRILDFDFNRFCIFHVIAWHEESTFVHLFSRTPTISEDDELNFQVFVALVARLDLKKIVYQSRTVQCPW